MWTRESEVVCVLSECWPWCGVQWRMRQSRIPATWAYINSVGRPQKAANSPTDSLLSIMLSKIKKSSERMAGPGYSAGSRGSFLGQIVLQLSSEEGAGIRQTGREGQSRQRAACVRVQRRKEQTARRTQGGWHRMSLSSQVGWGTENTAGQVTELHMRPWPWEAPGAFKTGQGHV